MISSYPLQQAPLDKSYTMTDALTTNTGTDDAQRETVRTKLQMRFGGDRAAALFGYWQLLAVPGGTSRLRSTLGPEGYRATLAAFAAAGIDAPRQASAGPAAGSEAHTGAGAVPAQTADRQLLRQAALAGLFAWGEATGHADISFVRGGAPGYPADSLVVGLALRGLVPSTFHRLEVRGWPALLSTAPPVLLRLGGHSDPAGVLRLFVSQTASSESAEVMAIFGDQPGNVEVVVYRCYDGPLAEDTSFIIARGTLR